MSFFKSRYGRTYYRTEAGDHQNTPLIGVHGGPGGFHQTILPVLELHRERSITLYDQIGTGQSDRIPEDKWIIDTFTENLFELMNHLGDKEYFLLGSSWGCTLILEFCRRYGFSRIKGIIFQSPMFNETLWSDDARILIGELSKEDQDAIRSCEENDNTNSPEYKKAMNHYYSKHLSRDPDSMEHVNKYLHLMNHDIYLHMWGPSEFCATGTLKDYNQMPFLSEIVRPVLYLCGEYDEARPDTCRKFSQLTTGSSISVLQGAGHMCSLDSTEEFVKLVSNFTAAID